MNLGGDINAKNLKMVFILDHSVFGSPYGY